ncbi:MAG: hypothetical protein JWO09_3082 [Bacteroidetes bacterium]|nr:hypothetical protein [Bacteroidota bacterium]
MKKILSILAIALAVVTSSCKKPAGEGGNSSIVGMVHVTNYNSNFTVVNAEYPGADVDVYIIYGDEVGIGNRIRTTPEGKFEFPYLRPGKYRVYVYSKDKDAYLDGNPNPPDKAVSVDVEINKKKQKVDVGTLEIFN